MIEVRIDEGPDEDGLYYVRVTDHTYREVRLKVPEDRTFGEMLRRAREKYKQM